ncbi:CLUMA_CG014048, isoform A [Clunio marinus]|uniref:CLUMA_CG014048, isoform A n=1 Tax=Clunio marinus TaxID=568069 RepID=A0A1J1IML4_9DIPT|nr:CLUMA_CG014048, isoform A [Clunio marinus]
MSPVFSTPVGATITHLSWPWSLHASSKNMTFWNDLLSALTQFSLFSSSTVSTSQIGHFVSTSTTTSITTTPSTTTAAPITSSLVSFYQYLESRKDFTSHSKRSLNQSEVKKYDISKEIRTSNVDSENNVSVTMQKDVKMLSVTSAPPLTSTNETVLISSDFYSNLSTDLVINNFVDCNDFTEQKLLNIVICSISDVNSNLINNSSSHEINVFNESLKNLSDNAIRFYNFNNSFYNETEVSGNNNTDIKATQFESTIYLIQVITTAVILGIIILATVIGEKHFRPKLFINVMDICLINNSLGSPKKRSYLIYGMLAIYNLCLLLVGGKQSYNNHKSVVHQKWSVKRRFSKLLKNLIQRKMKNQFKDKNSIVSNLVTNSRKLSRSETNVKPEKSSNIEKKDF